MLVSKLALKAGSSVAIYSVPRLLAEIRNTYDGDGGRSYDDLFDALVEVDLLHLDDLGAERQTALGARAALLPGERALRGRSARSLVTTNLIEGASSRSRSASAPSRA